MLCDHCMSKESASAQRPDMSSWGRIICVSSEVVEDFAIPLTVKPFNAQGTLLFLYALTGEYSLKISTRRDLTTCPALSSCNTLLSSLPFLV